jgi:hypothetical protein
MIIAQLVKNGIEFNAGELGETFTHEQQGQAYDRQHRA